MAVNLVSFECELSMAIKRRKRRRRQRHVDVVISAKLFQGLPNDLNINNTLLLLSTPLQQQQQQQRMIPTDGHS